MMDILLLFPGFIVAFIIVLCYEYKIRNLHAQLRNKVRFYVGRDKNGALWLYIGKPFKYNNIFYGKVNIFLTQNKFNYLGLNKNDYANLKFEDEPVEVFINMED